MPIRGEIVEQIAKIDIRHFAQCDDMRAAYAARYCPIEDRGHHCSRLAEKGDISRLCYEMRKRGVEPQARHHVPTQLGPTMRSRLGFAASIIACRSARPSSPVPPKPALMTTRRAYPAGSVR
jgi:hypothetical protein